MLSTSVATPRSFIALYVCRRVIVVFRWTLQGHGESAKRVRVSWSGRLRCVDRSPRGPCARVRLGHTEWRRRRSAWRRRSGRGCGSRILPPRRARSDVRLLLPAHDAFLLDSTLVINRSPCLRRSIPPVLFLSPLPFRLRRPIRILSSPILPPRSLFPCQPLSFLRLPALSILPLPRHLSPSRLLRFPSAFFHPGHMWVARRWAA